MTLPINANIAEREFEKSAENLIQVFKDEHIEGKLREYMVRLIDDILRNCRKETKNDTGKTGSRYKRK